MNRDGEQINLILDIKTVSLKGTKQPPIFTVLTYDFGLEKAMILHGCLNVNE